MLSNRLWDVEGLKKTSKQCANKNKTLPSSCPSITAWLAYYLCTSPGQDRRVLKWLRQKPGKIQNTINCWNDSHLRVSCVTSSIQKISTLWTYILSQFAGLIVWVENLIVKNGEIQGKAESDGMRGRHVLFAVIEGFLVGVFWFFNGSWGIENDDNDDRQKTDWQSRCSPWNSQWETTNIC